MNKTIATTIDIGSFQIKAASVKQKEDGTYTTYRVQVPIFYDKVGTGVEGAVKQAIEELEKKTKNQLESVYVSLQDPSMTSTKVVLTKKYKTPTLITESETLNIEEKIQSKVAAESPNLQAIYTQAIQYSIDGVDHTDPIDIQASNSVTASYFFVLIPRHIYERTMAIFASLGLEVVDYLPSPIASGYFGLSPQNKEAGTMVIDMGFRHTSIVIYDDSIPLLVSVMKYGVYDILKEIALKKKISLDEIMESEMHHTQSSKEIANITQSLLKKYFQAIGQKVSKTGKDHLLAGGIFLCGGGSHLQGIATIAKETLKLPIIKSAKETDSPQSKKEFSVVFGLSNYAISEGYSDNSALGSMFSSLFISAKKLLRSIYNNIS